jgi:hypothetical protein
MRFAASLGKKEVTLINFEKPFIYLDKNDKPWQYLAEAFFESPRSGDLLHVPAGKNTFNVCIPTKH